MMATLLEFSPIQSHKIVFKPFPNFEGLFRRCLDFENTIPTQKFELFYYEFEIDSQKLTQFFIDDQTYQSKKFTDFNLYFVFAVFTAIGIIQKSENFGEYLLKIPS